MKKSILALILILTICMIFSGCGGKDGGGTGGSFGGPSAGTPEKPENMPEDMSEYTSLYADILGENYAFIVNIESEVGPSEGMSGIWDAALALGDSALEELGYTFRDLNGDGEAELLIGILSKPDDAYTRNEIYAIYTLEDSEPLLLLEGMSRSAYSLKEDGSLFYQASDGAAYSMFGQFHLEGNDLICDDYYFTYPDDIDPSIIRIYHNDLGGWYIDESEELDMSLDEFWEMEEELAKDTVKLESTPFSKLDAEIAEKALEVKPAPSVSLLEGEWILVGGATEGWEYTAEEEGIESEISITAEGEEFTVYCWSKNVIGEEESFDAETIYVEEPLYYGCDNEEWSVKFLMTGGDFRDDEEYCAALTDENTLLVQHIYPFDGALGMSYQTYERQ